MVLSSHSQKALESQKHRKNGTQLFLEMMIYFLYP